MVNCDPTRLPGASCPDRIHLSLPGPRAALRAPKSRGGDPPRAEARPCRLGPPRLAPGRSALPPASRRRRRRRVAVGAAGDDRHEFNESQYKR
ncbi:unnamed protein product [Ostreobium quekettii]|uniref:Uncharacterized protein n=1 Tax=Ostreobium quekettii TaxID=121088 RepID=A0A8S1ILE5_9CHLO|nr:unnamed protein product [Ostreobium quekettii]